MADFTAPSWLFPKDGPFDNFIKGSQVGAAIAANRIRAKAVYAEIQQGQQRMDLAEREQITRDEAANLRNEVIRTKLANDAADFEVLREWWPQFQQSEGEIDMPVLRDENTMLKMSQAVAEKRAKIGMAAFAEFMATPGRDLANPEDQKLYYELMSRYKNIPARLGPEGVMGPIKVAESLKRLRDEANSRIVARDEASGMKEREMTVREGNLELRGVELEQKGKRLSLRDAASYKNELKAINDEEADKLKDMSATSVEADALRKVSNLKRRALTQKFYGTEETGTPREGLKTAEPVVPPPSVIAPATPMPPSKEELQKDQIYMTPRGRALWDGEKFIPR